MGASHSINNQTFNISGSNNTLTSLPKISSSISVPLELSNGVNPVYYSNLDELSILADLSTAQFLAAVEGIDFESLIPTEEEILEDSELTEHLRLFGITPSTFKGVFKGFSSINVNTITSFTKSLSNVLNVVNNSTDTKSLLKNLATKLAPVAGKFLKGLWDKKVGSKSDDQTKISTANVPVSDDNTLNASTNAQKNDIVTIPRLINISTTADNPLHDSTIGSNGPALLTDPTGAPLSKSDALLSNKMLVPFSDTVNALTQTAACSTIAENLEINAASVMAASTGSSPNILVTPPNATLVETLELIPRESQPIIEETVSLAGSIYGLSVANGSKSGPANTLQNLVDSVTIPGKQGMTLRNVNVAKRKYFSNFENYDTELLIASPAKVNTSDMTPVNLILNHPWLETMSPYSTDRVSLARQRYFYDTESFSVGVTDQTYATDILCSDPSYSDKVTAHIVHDYNYGIDDIYKAYNVTLNFVVSFYHNLPKVGNVSANTIVKPGIFSIIKDSNTVVFIPFRPIDDSYTSFRGSINTANLNTHAELWGSKGFFTFGVAIKPNSIGSFNLQDPNSKWNKTYTLRISQGSSNLTRDTTSMYVGNWVYDREFTDQPILNFVNTIHPGVLESQSPLDVNVVWQTITAKYIPYIPVIVAAFGNPEYDMIVASIARELKSAAEPSPTFKVYDFSQFSHVRRFIVDGIRTLTSWLYYSPDNIFDHIKPEYRLRIAWRILSIARAVVPIAVYNSSSSGTILSAWEHVSKLTSYDLHDKRDLPDVRTVIPVRTQRRLNADPALSKITMECNSDLRSWEI